MFRRIGAERRTWRAAGPGLAMGVALLAGLMAAPGPAGAQIERPGASGAVTRPGPPGVQGYSSTPDVRPELRRRPDRDWHDRDRWRGDWRGDWRDRHWGGYPYHGPYWYPRYPYYPGYAPWYNYPVYPGRWVWDGWNWVFVPAY